MKAFDASFLSLLLNEKAKAPIDPQTSEPVEGAHGRVKQLVRELEKSKNKIIIPTPALSEVLVLADERGASEYVDTLSKSSVFRIETFDERCAIETAVQLRTAYGSPQGKRLGSDSPWAKIKFDWQIVVIAKVNGADTIYSTDGDIKRLSDRIYLKVINVMDLPLPPPEQIEINYEEAADSTANPE